MTIKSPSPRSFDRELFQRWVLANVLGLPLAAGIGGAVAALIILLMGEVAREAPSQFDKLEWVGLSFIWITLGGLLGVFGGGSALLLALGGGGKLVGEAMGYPTLGPPLLGSLVLAVAGAVIGLGQGLVLRPHLHRSIWWVLANIAGWAVVGIVLGMIIATLVNPVSSQNPFYETATSVGVFDSLFSSGLVLGAVGGGVSGTLQWFILWWNSYPARWWVGASLVGWALGGAIAAAVPGGSGVLFGGAIAGIITGIPLVGLLRQPRD